MRDTILEKDTLRVTIGDDHTFSCGVVTLGRTGENAVTQLEITIPDELCDFWAYLDFKKPRGGTFKTPRLEKTNNVIEYDIPEGLLDESGNVEVQLVLENEKGEVWKSSVKKFVVLKSIDAGGDIPDPDTFISEAQKILDETVETTENFIAEANEIIAEIKGLIGVGASAISDTANGKVVKITDVSPIPHILNVGGSRENLLSFPYYTKTTTKEKLGGGYDANLFSDVECRTPKKDSSGNTIGSEGYFTLNKITLYRKAKERGITFPDGEELEFVVCCDFDTTRDDVYLNTLYHNGVAIVSDVPEAEFLSAWGIGLTCDFVAGSDLTYAKFYIKYYTTNEVTQDGVTFTDNGDGSISAKGEATENCYFYLMIGVDLGTTSINAKLNASATNGEYVISKRLMYFAREKELYILISKGETVNETLYPVLAKGTTLPTWIPYVDISTANVNVCGKNLCKGIVAYSNVSIVEGVVTQITADSTTGWIKCTATNNGTFISVLGTGTLAVGVQGVTFTKDNTFNQVNFGVGGTQRDTMVRVDVSHLPRGTYTISGNFTNITQGGLSWKETQIEVGERATEYECFKQPTTYLVKPDGTVDGVKSIFPTTTLHADTEGVMLDVEYNVDTKKYIDSKFAELASIIVNS